LAADVLGDFAGLGLRVRDHLAFEIGLGPVDVGAHRPKNAAGS
jgi:hypothetical protein